MVGSTPVSVPTKEPSEAYCPADAPTCQLASIVATPAFTWPACATPGASSSAQASTPRNPPRLTTGIVPPEARGTQGSSPGITPDSCDALQEGRAARSPSVSP